MQAFMTDRQFVHGFVVATLIGLAYVYIADLWRRRRRFEKASAYQFTEVLNRDKWKNAEQIRKDMQARLHVRLKEADVEYSLEALEAEGVIISRVWFSSRLQRLVSFRRLPERQFKLNAYDSDDSLIEGPPVEGDLVEA